MPSTRRVLIDPVLFTASPRAVPARSWPASGRTAGNGGGGGGGGGGCHRRGDAGGPASVAAAPLPPMDAERGEPGLDRLRRAVRAMAPEETRDLTLRQLAVLLLIQDGGAPRTACALAAELGIPRPAMTRALDRLGALDLALREPDPACRRNVRVRATSRGQAFLTSLRRKMARGASAA